MREVPILRSSSLVRKIGNPASQPSASVVAEIRGDNRALRAVARETKSGSGKELDSGYGSVPAHVRPKLSILAVFPVKSLELSWKPNLLWCRDLREIRAQRPGLVPKTAQSEDGQKLPLFLREQKAGAGHYEYQ